jgi:hypothetical protein
MVSFVELACQTTGRVAAGHREARAKRAKRSLIAASYYSLTGSWESEISHFTFNKIYDKLLTIRVFGPSGP